MKLHQILTGSCNKNEQCLSCGSVQNKQFVTYASGCDLVILDNNFNRVQVIPGVTNGSVQISCVDSCQETGKIAISYGKTICIYDPEPLTNNSSSEKVIDNCVNALNCIWYRSGQIESHTNVYDIAWAPMGEGLLTAGQWLQFWQPRLKRAVFTISETKQEEEEEGNKSRFEWKEYWNYNYGGVCVDINLNESFSSNLLAARRISFSSDGRMFSTLTFPTTSSALSTNKMLTMEHDKENLADDNGAASGGESISQENKSVPHIVDCSVLVWYKERLPAAFNHLGVGNKLNYRYMMLRHPAPVIACSWRRSSRYMPEGCVSNVLLTSCKDQVCRIWCESRANLQQGFCSVQSDINLQYNYSINYGSAIPPSLDNVTGPGGGGGTTTTGGGGTSGSLLTAANEFRSGFIRQLDKLRSIKYAATDNNSSNEYANEPIMNSELFSSLSGGPQSASSIHRLTVWHNEAHPHFAMVATINAQHDMPLPPSLPQGSQNNVQQQNQDFVLHWLHNKEMHFTGETERLIEALTTTMSKTVAEATHKLASTASGLGADLADDKPTVIPNAELLLQRELSKLDADLDDMLGEWCRSPDVVFAIRPIDGSLMVWLVHWLDESATVYLSASNANDFGHGSYIPTGGSASSRLRHVQVSVHSRLPQAMPLADASTLGAHLLIYPSNANRMCAAAKLLDQLQLERERWLRLKQEAESVGWQLNNDVSRRTSENVLSNDLPIVDVNDATATTTNTNCLSLEEKRRFNIEDDAGVVMVSHHRNGSLNQWHIGINNSMSLGSSSSSSSSSTGTNSMSNVTSCVFSVTHGARISGHRFHTNNAVCHPVLPLLLTTSHHNEPREEIQQNDSEIMDTSELIMWRVDSVGPLSHAPGIVELARVNSGKPAAFSSVAWFPALIPNSVLGFKSNSPAALFVSSNSSTRDFRSETSRELRLYLAIIDAGQLLLNGTNVPSAGQQQQSLHDYPIVSLQSTANPGCILELEALHDLTKNETFEGVGVLKDIFFNRESSESTTTTNDQMFSMKTLLLHVFAEDMVMATSSSSSFSNSTKLTTTTTTASKSNWSETYFIVRIIQINFHASKNSPAGYKSVKISHSTSHEAKHATCIEMWSVRITTRQDSLANQKGTARVIADEYCMSDASSDDDLTNRASHRVKFALHDDESQHVVKPNVTIKHYGLAVLCDKVCEQNLSLLLGDECKIIHANVAAGHLSSASIYPACSAPYLLATACSDGFVRLWKCDSTTVNLNQAISFHWIEWPMYLEKDDSSRLSYEGGSVVPGKPLFVSCAYSGRVAVAYQLDSNTQCNQQQQHATSIMKKVGRQICLCVCIYECESTGGAGWVLEETIDLGCVTVPELFIPAGGVGGGGVSSDASPVHAPSNSAHFSTTTSPSSNKIPRAPMLSSSGRTMTVDVHSSTTGYTESVDLQDYSTPPSLEILDSDSSNSTFKSIIGPISRFLYHQSSQDHPVATTTTTDVNALHSTNQSLSPKHDLNCQTTDKSLHLKPKWPIQLDWVSTEDGSHLFSIAVGTKILIYAAVSRDMMFATSAHGGTRGTLMTDSRSKNVHWLKLRAIHLASADDLPPFPLHCSWVREGLLVVGLDNEMHVYNQWKSLNRTETILQTQQQQQQKQDSKDVIKSPTTVPAASMTVARLTKTYSTFGLSRCDSTVQMDNKSQTGGNEFETTKTQQQPSVETQTSSTGMDIVSFIQDIGMFEAVQVCNPVLPQYHPRQLMEWMNFGKLRRVKAILAHLTRCVAPTPTNHRKLSSTADSDDVDSDGGSQSYGNTSRQRTISVERRKGNESTVIRAIPPLPLYILLTLDNAEAGKTDLPPGKDVDATLDEFNMSNYKSDNLLDDEDDEDDEIPGLKLSTRSKQRTRNNNATTAAATILDLCHFTNKDANTLSERLMRLQLPGLSALDQMYLLGIAELMANTRSEVTERLAGGIDLYDKAAAATASMADNSSRPRATTLVRMNTMGGGTGGYASPEGSLMGTTHSLDTCGLRFLLNMQHHSYMLRTLPMQQRTALLARGMSTGDIVWAFHSEAEEELFCRLPCMAQDQMSWNEFKQYGCGWWIRNDNTLRRCVEKIAKNAYQASRDPMDAAIFYLAMKKQKILAALFKNSDNRTFENFFRLDFSDPANQTKAKKNAFHLLTKRRYTHVAALFLLAGSLNDAIQVCIRNLQDLQLALVIARLYESSSSPSSLITNDATTTTTGTNKENVLLSPILTELWKERVLSLPDPFLRSMAHWSLGDYEQALETLLIPSSIMNSTNSPQSSPAHRLNNNNQSGKSSQVSVSAAAATVVGGESNPHSSNVSSPSSHHHSPTVFNFYVFLRHHPLLIRRRQLTCQPPAVGKLVLGGAATTVATTSIKNSIGNKMTSNERRLYFTTAHRYMQMGCPALALEVLSQLPQRMKVKWKQETQQIPISDKDVVDKSEVVVMMKQQQQSKEEKPPTSVMDSLFQWSAIDLPAKKEEDPFKIQWSDDDEDDDDDDEDEDGKFETSKTKESSSDDKTLSISDTKYESETNEPQVDDEVTVIDVMAQQLKFIACLRLLCEEMSTLATGIETNGSHLRYHFYQWLEREVMILREVCLNHSFTKNTNGILSHVFHPFTSNVVPESDKNLSETEQRLAIYERRRTWLETHRALLHSLASYCSLQGASGVGLASLRMELLLLLQELQHTGRLQARLPPSVHLPLIKSLLSQTRSVLANPIQHIRLLVRDIMDSISSLDCPHATQTTVDLKTYERNILLLRNLSCALSACIYQGLSESKSACQSQGNTSSDKLEIGVLQNLVTHFLKSMNNVVYSDGCELIIRHRTPSSASGQSSYVLPNSEPKKWPGTPSVVALLTGGSTNSHSADQASKLASFLCEILVAVYVGLLGFSLHSCDSGLLYRLCAHPLDKLLWGRVFGGVLRKTQPERPPPPSVRNISESPQRQPPSASPVGVHQHPSSGSIGPTVIGRGRQDVVNRTQPTAMSDSQDSVMIQRQKLISRVAPPRPERPRVDENFVQPELSIISALMEKPVIGDSTDFAYDSEQEEKVDEIEDDYDDVDFNEFDDRNGIRNTSTITVAAHKNEWMNPKSFSWNLMRLAVIHRALERIQMLMQMLDFEPAELGTSCNHLLECVKRIRMWEQQVIMSLPPPPSHYVTRLNRQVESLLSSDGSNRAKLRYQALLNTDNTPFEPVKSSESLPVKRLWLYLVRQESLRDLFVRHVYRTPPASLNINTTTDGDDGHKSSSDNSRSTATTTTTPSSASAAPLVKLVHKEQDALLSLCINQANLNCIAVCTGKEVVELDISHVLNPPTWLDDDIEYDIEILRQPPYEHRGPDDFILLDKPYFAPSAPGVFPTPRDTSNQYSSNHVMQKRSLSNVLKLASHPSLPYYMCVTSTTQMHLFEWDSKQAIVNAFSSPCHKAKLQTVKFDSNGRKFGVGDSEGIFALWHLSLAANMNLPYFTCRSHRRGVYDFTFLQSASVLCTGGIPGSSSSGGTGSGSNTSGGGGMSSGGGGIAHGDCSADASLVVWDTLIPSGRNAVQQYSESQLAGGCTAVSNVGRYQSLLVGTKRGELAMVDLRQASVRYSFPAHDNVAIKSIAVDPMHQFCATGAADGSIKLWKLGGHELLASYRNEHNRTGASALFRQHDLGTTHLQLLSQGRLLSCGGDGSIRLRSLQDLGIPV